MAKRPGSDSGQLDFPSPTEAHHNKEGLYTMTEPKPGEYDTSREVQTEGGIYLEMPDFKQFRILWVDTISGHFQIECEETEQQIKDVLALAANSESVDWYEFTDPTYGHKNHVPRSVLQHPVAIVSQWRDMEGLREQIRQVQLQKRLQAIQNAKQGGIPQVVKDALRRNPN